MSDPQTKPVPRVTHNTLALEEAIISSVKIAAAPAYRAIAEAQFLKAKALLLRIVGWCVLILCVAFVVFLVWQAISKSAQQLSLIIQNDEAPALKQKQDPASEVQNVKERELREILQTQTSSDPTTKIKGIRDNVSSSKMTNDLINPTSSIGSLTTVIAENSLTENTVPVEAEIIENMVVGPEVQSLTVFKEREIRLTNELEVKIVAGHRYANNSSTNNWREGYCYVTWFDELNITVDVATKPGKAAAAIDAYVMPKVIDMLGGLREVNKLRRLCPWMTEP